MPLDVTDRKAMHKSVEDVVLTHFGEKGLDILILNAGKSQRLPAMKTDLQMTRDLMNLNFESLVDMTLKVMKTDKWVEREVSVCVLFTVHFFEPVHSLTRSKRLCTTLNIF